MAENPIPLPNLKFGVYEVDFRAGELRKRGVRIRLQEKPLQMLGLLLSEPGKVVTREELKKRLWPDETFVDFDHGINIAITKLRQALSDSASNPRFIETLSRHGYRFIAPVNNRGHDPEMAGRKMLVVLPFENLGAGADQDYFADGLTEEMIAQLGRLQPRQLGVIARMTAMCYKGSKKRTDEIGRELGVDYILEGSVRRAGERVRITAQLVQVSDQTHLWAESYDRTVADVLDIQDEVARRIAGSLAMELLPGQKALSLRSATNNPAAYEAYLKGRYFWNRRTEEGFRQGIEYFNQAIQEDPNYGMAYAGIADCYETLALYGGVPPQEARQRAEQAAKKALQIDDLLAEAHTSLAFARLLFDWDWVAAERGFRMAIELNPNYVTGHHWYGLSLALMGRFDEALAQMEITLELDPLSLVMNSHKGWILYFARRFEEAADQLVQALEIDPTFPVARYFLGLTYLQMGKIETAIDEFQKARELSGTHPAAMSGLGLAHGMKGKTDEARGYARQIEELARKRYVAPYFIACIYIGLGEKERALDLVEESYKEHSSWMGLMKVDPVVDVLRGEERFGDLMLRVGLGV
jgi:TolB-like protein/Flp pilus assembly protein TadD